MKNNQAIILEHFNHPKFKVSKIDAHNFDFIATTVTNHCHDQLTFGLNLTRKSITLIQYEADACLLTIAVAEILIQSLLGHSVDQGIKIIKNFLQMAADETFDANLIGSLIVFEKIKNHPSRFDCVINPSLALLKTLERKIYEA